MHLNLKRLQIPLPSQKDVIKITDIEYMASELYRCNLVYLVRQFKCNILTYCNVYGLL